MSSSPLAELVEGGAFDGPTVKARRRNAQRWAEGLSAAIRSKIEGKWFVSPYATLPSGRMVERFLKEGQRPDHVEGLRLPPEADNWNEKDRERFLNTHTLLKRHDQFCVRTRHAPGRARDALFAKESTETGPRRTACRPMRGRCGATVGASTRTVKTLTAMSIVGGRADASHTSQEAKCSAEAWELFGELYLHQNKLSIAEAWRYVRGEARKHGLGLAITSQGPGQG